MVATHERDPMVDSAAGLTMAEAVARRAEAGPTRLPQRSSRTYSRIVSQNLLSFLNLLIFAIAVALAVLGQFVDALMTASLATVNVGVATVQEIRAKRQLDKIALLTRPMASVIRDGEERHLEVDAVVVDDLLILRPGDQVVVDGIVVSDGHAAVDESLLTGESEHVQKTEGDRLYSGSFLMTGSARFRATAIGAQSMAQQMSLEARRFRNVRTPLQTELAWLMRFLLIALLLMSTQVLNTINQLYPDFPFEEAARNAAVIVGLVPQGLVVMVVITYAMAIVRLAGRGALVQRMNAVESMSHVDVLCLDKTGTITTNNLMLDELIVLDDDETFARQALGGFVSSMSSGNQTSEAIARDVQGQRFSPRFELPFSSTYKWSGIATDCGTRPGTYVLGAPEALHDQHDAAIDVDRYLKDATAQGKRALLFAYTPEVVDLGTTDNPVLPDSLSPLAIVILADELRTDAKETFDEFARSGIRMKVISGDNPETVAALARQAGLEISGTTAIVTGGEIEGLDDTSLAVVAENATVFGRSSPQLKERLIKALKDQGHYVAMIGDGVNDVLALKQAHVAVAMRTGSEAARSVADLVLVDDSFAVLPQTFKEGQRVRNGMKLSMELFLTRTFYTMLVIYVVAIMGDMFPIAFRHGVLVAALTVGVPAFAFAIFAEPGPTERRLLPDVFRVVMPASLTIGALLLVVYRLFLTLTGDVLQAQTALTTTAMLCGLLLVVFLRPPSESWTGATGAVSDRRPAMLAIAMLALYVAIAIVPPLNAFVELQTLPLSGYLMISIAVIGWAVSLRWLWRLRIVDRIAGFLLRTWRSIRAAILRIRKFRTGPRGPSVAGP
jgi:cation-transporting P-type ATPase E